MGEFRQEGTGARPPHPSLSATDGGHSQGQPARRRLPLLHHAPLPCQRCYRAICRRTAGGGYAVNIMGTAASLRMQGKPATRRARLRGEGGQCGTSSAHRHCCHPLRLRPVVGRPALAGAGPPLRPAIDTPLPVPAARVHLLLRFKAAWVAPELRPGDEAFEEHPRESIEDWHKAGAARVD